MNILTEEELKEREKTFYQLCHYGTMSEATRDQAIEIIESHRNLLSANAELSFKNQKYKESLEKIQMMDIKKDDRPDEMLIILRLTHEASRGLRHKMEDTK